MNPDLVKLIELQKVDAEITRLNAEIAALPKRVQAIEAQLADSNDRLEKAKAAIKADEAARRKYESEIQSQNDKISKYREQSLAVKTNDQYKALMQEIQFAEQNIKALEDKILETMLDADVKENVLKAAEAELKAERAEIEKEKEHARTRTAVDEKALAEQNAKRNDLRSGVNPNILEHYERLLKARGSGIAEAREQRCTACQVLLRPQIYNEVRGNEGVQICDSCSRILYYDPANEPAEDPKAKTGSKAGGAIEREWVYLDEGENGVFAVLVNSKGSCSLRTFDRRTGLALAPPKVVKGQSFRQAFREYIENGRPLFLDHNPNLEQDCKDALPPELLTELQRQAPNRTVTENGQ
ncbi:MAG TPA: C4-type zinc ribbon domain-containing protein [Clostridia bacterium]|nr:C4-type zinc ribbon domain-containing protein [Clostridia bacterium]